MRLIVLDTNVVVSAGIHPESPPAKIVMNWILEGNVNIVTCPLIIEEYREVVRRQKFRAYGFPPYWLEFMVEESLFLENPPPWFYPGPDPKDLHFLSLAYTTGAWLVTGNLKHFPESIRGDVPVITPAAYLVHLGQEINESHMDIT